MRAPEGGETHEGDGLFARLRGIEGRKNIVRETPGGVISWKVDRRGRAKKKKNANSGKGWGLLPVSGGGGGGVLRRMSTLSCVFFGGGAAGH